MDPMGAGTVLYVQYIFQCWIVEGSQCWITYLRGSFMMDNLKSSGKKKLQQASSAELQLSSFEVLFWVFHEDMKMFIY